MPYMDHQNAKRLVDTYADLILRISLIYLKQTYDAEDICQEVFLKLLSNDLAFERPDHEKAWIIRTTINACKDHLRKAFFRKTVPMEEYAEQPVQTMQTSLPSQMSDLMEVVMSLPENWRISIILYYYEGYSTGEIADLLGKRENTVSAWLSRGRKQLKKLIEADHRELLPAGQRNLFPRGSVPSPSSDAPSKKGAAQHV